MRKLTMEAIRKVEARLFDKPEGKELAMVLRMLMRAQSEVDNEKIERKRVKRNYTHYF